MKKLVSIKTLTVMSAAILVSGVMAAETRPTDRLRADRISDRPVVVGTDRPDRPSRPDIERPDRPDRPVAPELREHLDRIKEVRERYLNRQRELRKEMHDATDEQRDELRDQVKENRERWIEFQRELRDRVRDRAKDIREHLNTDLREVVDRAQDDKIRDRRD